jgi:hypothetical protein
MPPDLSGFGPVEMRRPNKNTAARIGRRVFVFRGALLRFWTLNDILMNFPAKLLRCSGCF